MKAIILAAGRGTRLGKYCENKPKCLVEINGASLLSRNLSILRKFDIDVTVVGGYRVSQISSLGVSTIVNADYKSTNMVISLFCAENILQQGAIISYGDIVYSPKVMKRLLESKYDISVAVDKNWFGYWSKRMINPLDDLETLQIDKVGNIIEIGSKAHTFEEIDGQYIGLIKVTRQGASIFQKVYKESKKNGYMNGKPICSAYFTDLLQETIRQGNKVSAIPFTDTWVEIDTVQDLNSEFTSVRMRQIDSEISEL